MPKGCYDVIVVGAGHAGCEAALASARLGCKTLVITLNIDNIALMSCNPAIGGIAKGHLVREIDAIGGEMARITDLTGIQFRMLNTSKGPAVQAIRAQVDRNAYKLAMRSVIESYGASSLLPFNPPPPTPYPLHPTPYENLWGINPHATAAVGWALSTKKAGDGGHCPPYIGFTGETDMSQRLTKDDENTPSPFPSPLRGEGWVRRGFTGEPSCPTGAQRGMKTPLPFKGRDRVGMGLFSGEPPMSPGSQRGMKTLHCHPELVSGSLGKEILKQAQNDREAVFSDEPSCPSGTQRDTKIPLPFKGRDRVGMGLFSDENIDITQGMVERLIVKDGKVRGIETNLGTRYEAKAVILTTGTFLRGLIHVGMMNYPAGRAGEFPATGLSEDLKRLGFTLGRLKTGTSPRLDARSIDFSVMTRQEGDDPAPPFSYMTEKIERPQVPCYLTYTSPTTHEIIKKNLDRSPLYGGVIKGIGPRYCPSIEDKVVRFSHREKHQVFLEPEGYKTVEIYANGISTSLPLDVQIEMVRSIRGLEEAEIIRTGYAIEYDFVPPTQLKHTLETKLIEGLYNAGQINGTSGYEEAAAQGIMAGINAALKIQGKEQFILDRSEAYIGVLIDDLITKGTQEPYRMFTSRAEYRLLLRHDNADSRLTEKGYNIGLISEGRYKKFVEKKTEIENEIARLRKTRPPLKRGNTTQEDENAVRPEQRAESCEPVELSNCRTVEGRTNVVPTFMVGLKYRGAGGGGREKSSSLHPTPYRNWWGINPHSTTWRDRILGPEDETLMNLGSTKDDEETSVGWALPTKKAGGGGHCPPYLGFSDEPSMSQGLTKGDENPICHPEPCAELRFSIVSGSHWEEILKQVQNDRGKGSSDEPFISHGLTNDNETPSPFPLPLGERVRVRGLFSSETGIGRVSPDTTLAQLLQRPEMDYTIIERLAPAGRSLSDEVKRRVEIEIKYDGYIKRQLQLIEKFKYMEDKRIPADFDYSSIPGLSREVIEKLAAIKPASLGQASRVPGVTPAAVSILAITLAKQLRRKG